MMVRAESARSQSELDPAALELLCRAFLFLDGAKRHGYFELSGDFAAHFAAGLSGAGVSAGDAARGWGTGRVRTGRSLRLGIGETLTKTRAGLKPSVVVPVAAASNTNLDNGLVPQGWGVEQFTLTLNHYAATTDLNMVTSRVGIAGQFSAECGDQWGAGGAKSLDELARNALFCAVFWREYAGAGGVGFGRAGGGGGRCAGVPRRRL